MFKCGTLPLIFCEERYICHSGRERLRDGTMNSGESGFAQKKTRDLIRVIVVFKNFASLSERGDA